MQGLSMKTTDESPSVTDCRLQRNAHGRLELTLPGGTVHAGVIPVRAFPIAAPDEGLSLIGVEGSELLWVPRLSEAPAAFRELIEEELQVREFVPVIEQIESVSGFSTPCVWDVRTNRGPAQLQLKAEEDIRRLENRSHLLIASGDGVQFRVSNVADLDRHSRKLLERFL
jgi:hypothetical protein